MMSEFLLILFNAALLNNLVMSQLLGLDLQVATSRRMQVAWFTGVATLLCITVSVPLARIIDVLLLAPMQLGHYDIFIYVLTIAFVVTAFQQIIVHFFPLLVDKANALGPLLLMNSILLAVMLLQQRSEQGFFMLAIQALANGFGFLFLLLLMTCLRERIDDSKVPQAFRGVPILLFSLGLFSMGLMGLTGIE